MFDILKEFTIKNIDTKSLFIDPRQILDKDSISIVIRKDRFSEKVTNLDSIDKSRFFVKRTIDYIFKSIKFFLRKFLIPNFLFFK